MYVCVRVHKFCLFKGAHKIETIIKQNNEQLCFVKHISNYNKNTLNQQKSTQIKSINKQN